jgi:phospholipase C
MSNILTRFTFVSVAVALLAGCDVLPVSLSKVEDKLQLQGRGRDARSPIQHIVLLIQEDRSFNDLFATTKVGCMIVVHGKHTRRVKVPLRESNLAGGSYFLGSYSAYQISYDHGSMCGFSLTRRGSLAYGYVKPAQIRPYLAAAADYALADRMFQTQGSGDFTAHQDLIRGGTEVSPTASVIDYPMPFAFGCDSRIGTATSLITNKPTYERGRGPFPCFTYDTLQTRLDAKSVSWKYYTPPTLAWNAFAAVAAVWDNASEWTAHISSPEANVLRDIADGTLPAMSWVIPSFVNSDASGRKEDHGPAWVSRVVDAIGNSSYWNSTAIVIVWDDWGGFYDPIPPPFVDNQGGAGFRVPMIVVSPYVPQGEVSHTVYEFGSIVRFIEDTWKLGRLGTTDTTCKSIGNMFDFQQPPRAFVPISS